MCATKKNQHESTTRNQKTRAFNWVAQEQDRLLPAGTRITARKKISGGRNHQATKIVGALRLSAGRNTARKRQSILTQEHIQGPRQDLGCDHKNRNQ
jgi:hypothetical protein